MLAPSSSQNHHRIQTNKHGCFLFRNKRFTGTISWCGINGVRDCLLVACIRIFLGQKMGYLVSHLKTTRTRSASSFDSQKPTLLPIRKRLSSTRLFFSHFRVLTFPKTFHLSGIFQRLNLCNKALEKRGDSDSAPSQGLCVHVIITIRIKRIRAMNT